MLFEKLVQSSLQSRLTMNQEYGEAIPSGVRRIGGTSSWVKIDPPTGYEQAMHILRVMRAYAKPSESLNDEITRQVNNGTITQDEAEKLKLQMSPEPQF
jgi:hypothetical protein